MEGLDRLKILSEEVHGTPNWLSYILIVLTLVFLVMYIYINENSINKNMEKSLLCFGAMFICIILYFLGACGVIKILNKYETRIKVTPIEDKYYIDMNKYEVIDTEGEIITLKIKE